MRIYINACRSWQFAIRVSLAALAACGAERTGAARAGQRSASAPNASQSAMPSSTSAGFANASDVAAPRPNGMRPTPSRAAETTIEPAYIDACSTGDPAGLSNADVQKLRAGAGTRASLRVLYPYAGTVFPRGLLAPLLMWDGVDADAVYVHIKSRLFEYHGCLKPTARGQVQLPQDVWVAAGAHTLGPSDPFTLALSTLQSGTVTGPVSQQFTIAQASVKGSIFYNSYSSALGTGATIAGNGMVLRIPPGGTAEAFTSMECNGCHSVSANGARLLSAALVTGGLSYALTPDVAANPPPMAAGPKGAFGALYPDGSLYLAMSTAINVCRMVYISAPLAPVDAMLYRTDDGTVVPNTGIPPTVLMPTFSPSGRLLAFTDLAIKGPGPDGGYGLAIMNFDVSTTTASGYRTLFIDDKYRPGWPFTLPDDRAVVFTRTDSPDWSGGGAGIIPDFNGAFSELYIGDIASGKVTLLAKAMGYDTPQDAASNKSYVPFGEGDLHNNYQPTVSPVAAGGYFWVFFDSYRNYGNLGRQRQLWGAAIDLRADGNYALDPSHPPFYLPGQEWGTGNHRAFAALDPCQQNGTTCTSGTDCCGGFCFVANASGELGTEPQGRCASDKPACSKPNERCSNDGDCCSPAPGQSKALCVAGFCAPPAELF